MSSNNSTTATATVAERMRDVMQEGIAAEERRHAEAGTRTVRVVGSVHNPTTEPVWVIEDKSGVYCLTAGLLGNPVGDALPGQTYSWKAEDIRDRRRRVLVEKTFVGKFNIVADVRDPITGERICLGAEVGTPTP